jgi:hypothetical protein
MMARTRVLGAVTRDSNYEVSIKKPLDARSLVKTYDDLLNINNWVNANGNPIVYNGMIVAVWLNTADISKNGIYFLHDSSVTSAKGTPDVTKETNWHKIGGIEALPSIADQVTTLQSELETIKSDVDDLQDSATVVVNLKTELPNIGMAGKIYVVTEEAMTYVWYNNDYLPVGDGGDNEEIQIIHGGSASAK